MGCSSRAWTPLAAAATSTMRRACSQGTRYPARHAGRLSLPGPGNQGRPGPDDSAVQAGPLRLGGLALFLGLDAQVRNTPHRGLCP
jgi:hypothetical protein